MLASHGQVLQAEGFQKKETQVIYSLLSIHITYQTHSHRCQSHTAQLTRHATSHSFFYELERAWQHLFFLIIHLQRQRELSRLREYVLRTFQTHRQQRPAYHIILYVMPFPQTHAPSHSRDSFFSVEASPGFSSILYRLNLPGRS